MAAQDNSARTFKILLLGERNVGKNCGPIHFDLWDIPGEIDSQDIQETYVKGADAAVLMFDLQSRSTLDSIPRWYEKIQTSAGGELPMALCGNKVDLPYRRLGPKSITFHREKGLSYFDMSAKSDLNLRKPFIWLASRVLDSLSLEETAALSVEAVPHLEIGPVKPTISLKDEGSSTPFPSNTAVESGIRRRLECMAESLQQHPNIRVTEAKISASAPQSEIDEAKKYANGRLPSGVEEFYKQVGSFRLEWELISPEMAIGDIPSTGHIRILTILEIFGDNWRDITWFPLPDYVEPTPDDEWRLRFRNVLPFDFFIPEACMCFIQEPAGTPEDYVAYHYFGEELYKTRYTFGDYVERLLASHGYWYWMETLCSESADSAQVDSFRANMPRIFAGYDDSLFQP
ncbi:P-loop containing nucleoside triphosphate hydrolase protein [Dactylonectria macrodidyma]|uniref:P-loop containing nucleoside triphosphate hydrolase protein n=1 Tax=Dactylonectria macrodidyma TaxID=307937 RepID=A0A9P9DSW9_9HYPO|nr:P-loop containing nucleoside triphosphate hydrolase protein [Dactylonectria macrodidyma]